MKFLLSALILLASVQASFAFEIICYGKQPSWSASIGDDSLLFNHWDLDYGIRTLSTVTFDPENDTNADQFQVKGNNISIEAHRVGSCSTDPNSVVYSHKATVNLSGQTLKGCCRVAY